MIGLPTRLCLAFAVLACPVFAADGPAFSPRDVVFFEKKIRPILVAHCYACHSAKAARVKKLRGGLWLDNREGLRKGGETGAAIVPGKPDESLLLKALNYDSLEMPPKEKLPATVIADFREWITRGAPDPRRGRAATISKVDIEAGRNHWAYRPLKKPPIPRPGGQISSSPVDAFLLARLKAAGLHQAAEANRHILVRRLYFDLIGLPPTPDQVEIFVSDDSPEAYTRLVDRLLASPHFGERWGRHWLDVVRFAESITLRGFLFPEAWRYRDYVVETFNADRSLDRFVQEQVSGDLLPSKSLRQRQRNVVATTFLALGNNNLEDQDKDKLRMDVVDEQLETISRAFLAQTIGCARCHDHKFDPIPTSDYYALAGILRNTKTLNHANVSKWIELPLPVVPARTAQIKKHERAVAALTARIKTLKGSTMRKGLAPLPLAKLAGVVVDDLQAVTTGTWMTSQFTKSYIGSGYQHDMGKQKGGKTARFRPRLPRDGEYEVRFAYTPGGNRSPAVPVTVVSADGSKTITINQKLTPPLDGRFISLGRHRFQRGGSHEVAVTNAGTTEVVIIDAVQFLPVELSKKKPVAKNAPAANSPKNQKRLRTLQQQLKVLQQQAPGRPKYMSVEEEKTIGDTRIHVRGNVHNLGAVAPRGFLQVISLDYRPGFSDKQSGRRELGRWITHRDNPLTARVLANRLWHWLFGAGLVRTTDNFGTTGELPSHPGLLDYLAARLIEQNWSAKSLLRELTLTRTYRLTSGHDRLGSDRDPDNRLFWRMNRRRLDAESLLDAMLSVSGRLQTDLGGPLIRSGTTNDYNYRHDSNRRALYWPVLRNSLPQLFKVFDFANPSMVTGRRENASTTPQALFLMNNPWVLQQADHAAERLLGLRPLGDHRRIQLAVRATLGRPPTPGELQSMLVFVGSENDDKTVRRQKWAQLIQVLFASIDFRYLR